MNNYCQYLKLNIPLLKETFNFEKSKHIRVDPYSVLTDEILNWFTSLNLTITLVEIFYTEPNKFTTIHTDALGGNYTKLNWQFGGKDSYMLWYKDIVSKSSTSSTPISTPYIQYNIEEVSQVHKQEIKNPSLVQVGIPHNIINSDEDRWVVSVVFKRTKSLRRPTWNDSLSIFEDFLEKS